MSADRSVSIPLRDADGTVTVFVPTKTQRAFLRDPARECWLFGEVGSGKTVALAHKLSAEAAKLPGRHVGLAAATWSMLVHRTLPAFMDALGEEGCKWTSLQHHPRSVTLRNGCTVWLATLDRLTTFDGRRWSALAVDGAQIEDARFLPRLRCTVRAPPARLFVAWDLPPNVSAAVATTRENKYLPPAFVVQLAEQARGERACLPRAGISA